MSLTWGKNGQYKTFREFLESDEGKSSISDFVAEMALKQERKQINVERIKKFYDGDQEFFDRLMDRIEKRHDDRWDDVCYKNGYEPYPWEVLYSVFDLARVDGVQLTTPLDGLTENFPSEIYEYMGWQFAVTFGQGSVMSIYHNKNLKFRI